MYSEQLTNLCNLVKKNSSTVYIYVFSIFHMDAFFRFLFYPEVIKIFSKYHFLFEV